MATSSRDAIINSNNISQGQSIHILDCPFLLLPSKLIYWASKRTLIIADLHLGKITHFRKAGIAVPLALKDENWRNLNDLINTYNPIRILFLGDLFHSSYNAEWEELISLMDVFPEVEFHLIVGNHDILDQEIYDKSQLLSTQTLVEDQFIFTHHPLENIPEGQFNFCGHIHPSVRLVGKGKDSLRLPCFYQMECQMILPAFGAFTGSKNLDINEASFVYGIIGDEVLKIK